MYIRATLSFKQIFKKNALPILLLFAYCFLIFRLYDYRGMEKLDIPMSISTVLGFAVSLLLGFRTSEAYDRWWEARKIWGAIVNDSRTFARQLIGYVHDSSKQPEVYELINLNIAWCYALKNALRKTEVLEEAKPFVNSNDLEFISKHNNIPNALLLVMVKRLGQLKASNSITNYEFVELDLTLKRHCDQMGMAERIKNTVFPAHYRFFTHLGILLFIMMLPFGMLKSTGMFMILITILVYSFFTTLEHIAHTLQDPFSDRGSDTPMSSICNTIEINLKQMMNNPQLPKKVEASDRGILM